MTGENLMAAVKTITGKYELELENCVGFSSDGANNVAGAHNSVWSRIHEKSPNAVQLKCTCHSIALCVQHAFEELPSSLGAMLSDVPN